MGKQRIELVFFEGCPNVGLARDNLRSALQSASEDITWTEWELGSDSTPKDLRSHGSPTVLIDGRDVTGDTTGAAANGLPSGRRPVGRADSEKSLAGNKRPDYPLRRSCLPGSAGPSACLPRSRRLEPDHGSGGAISAFDGDVDISIRALSDVTYAAHAVE